MMPSRDDATSPLDAPIAGTGENIAPLWSPSASQLAATQLSRFRGFLRDRHEVDLSSYESLHRWSVEHLEDFWSAIAAFFRVDGIDEGTTLVGDGSIRGTRWFPTSKVNFAAALLKPGDVHEAAIIGAGEDGPTVTLTRGELRDRVARVAGYLRGAGVEQGDVVAGFVSNVPDAVIAFLASAWIGATWSSVGSDYAVDAAISRLGALQPKVLVATSGNTFGGRYHDGSHAIAEIRANISSITHTIVIGTDRLSDDQVPLRVALESSPVDAVHVPFEHPLWVLFTSGTTGQPKGIVHGHGGILLEMLKLIGLHWDLNHGDRLLWYSSPSWVMWNIQLSALAVGATIICYSGSPVASGSDQLFRLATQHGATFLGTSPAYLQRYAHEHLETTVPTTLRAVGVTGAPLPPELHIELARRMPTVPIWSVSGGTDVASGLCGGSPDLPVLAGELSAACLAVDLRVRTEDGSRANVGTGEMIIEKPMPSMPISLWNDADGSLYRSTYLSLGESTWQQGDWITVNPQGSIVIHGRSDATLNRNGVRMGSADIYAVVDEFEQVADSLVIGVEAADGSYWMPLFVTLHEDVTLDESLVDSIRSALRTRVSPRHVPDQIIAVPALPRTRTGKRVEVPIKRLMLGVSPERAVNLESLANPEAMQWFVEMASSRFQRSGVRGVSAGKTDAR